MDNNGTNVNYTYLLECADGTFCCGWTNNPEKRLAAHNSGTAAKYTRTRLPVKLVYYEAFPTRQEAMRREFHIKRLKRQEKIRLMKENRSLFPSDVDREKSGCHAENKTGSGEAEVCSEKSKCAECCATRSKQRAPIKSSAAI